MSGNSVREHIEVEVAVLAGVLGFFIGGLIRINGEILDIILSAVLSGTAVFVVTYYAMILIFSGKKKDDISGEFVEGLPEMSALAAGKNEKKSANKGSKLDIVSKDDDLMNDIFGNRK
jgi:hypothetical protein